MLIEIKEDVYIEPKFVTKIENSHLGSRISMSHKRGDSNGAYIAVSGKTPKQLALIINEALSRGE